MRKIFLFLLVAVAAFHVTYGQNRELQIFRGGNLVQSFNVATLDSVKVGYSLNAPATVNAKLDGKSVAVSWTAVQGAVSYQVYRSSDANAAYKLLASDITGTSYMDSSPLDGANYYKVKAIGPDMQSQLTTTSAFIMYEDDNSLLPGLYMGIVGFNDKVIDKGAMTLLAPNTKSDFISFVNSLTTEKNTVLYYGVDQALDKLTSTPFPSDLHNAAVVTFTDGLDQGSLGMVDYKYSTRDEYRTYLGNRIKATKVQGYPLTAYCIGLRGGDVTNVDAFKNQLKSLSSDDSTAMEVTDMSEVDTRFKEIADQLIKTTEKKNISIKFPKLDDGQIYRFTFDNVTDASLSQCCIEGTMNVRNNTLNNVVYKGLTCASGTMIQGTPSGKSNVVFDFEDVKMADGTSLSLDYVNEYYLEGAYWQVNSEFDRGEDLQVSVSRSSAAIMLVLDCSSSLQKDGDKFTEMKTHAKSFIEKLAAVMDEIYMVTGINLNYSTLTVKSGSTAQLIATVSPSKATNKSVSWSSSNTNVATVDYNGVVTAVSEGTCTITAKAKDGSGKKATCEVTVQNDKSGTIDGHDYVDLGLPSGTLWATCNVGASKPDGYGNYYAWGETATKTTYNWSTYKLTSDSGNTLTKYTDSSSAELEPADDAAYVNWGKNWRMPSKAQYDELINSSYTTTTWTSINSIYGIKITSKIPGYESKYIFLPAAGCYDGGSLSFAGSSLGYWSRTLYVSDASHAWYLYFGSNKFYTDYYYRDRYYGQSIRPVRFSE